MVLPFLFFFYRQEQQIFIRMLTFVLAALVSSYIGFKWLIGPNSSTGLWGARQYKEPSISELVKSIEKKMKLLNC